MRVPEELVEHDHLGQTTLRFATPFEQLRADRAFVQVGKALGD
jgi:hypothetical protein